MVQLSKVGQVRTEVGLKCFNAVKTQTILHTTAMGGVESKFANVGICTQNSLQIWGHAFRCIALSARTMMETTLSLTAFGCSESIKHVIILGTFT